MPPGPARRPGDALLSVTKNWLAVPSTLHRPMFETCLETGELHHPRTAAMKAMFGQAQLSRCDRLQELPADRQWVAFDCLGYGSRPRPADGNATVHGRSTPLSLCAPAHVAIACLSCSRQHLREGLDMGLPPITPRKISGVPQSREEVERRCRAHASDAMRLAASFRGNAKHGAPVRARLRSSLAKTSHGRVVPGFGPISVRVNDMATQGKPVGNSSSMAMDLLHSQFGLVPRGDSYFSYRLSEVLAFGVVPVVIADDWALPFEEIIDWSQIALRVREHELEKLPSLLAATPLDTVCAMRGRVFDVYHKWLRGPAQWDAAVTHIFATRRWSNGTAATATAALPRHAANPATALARALVKPRERPRTGPDRRR